MGDQFSQSRSLYRALVCDDDSTMGRLIGDTLVSTFPRISGKSYEDSCACDTVITRSAFDASMHLKRVQFDLLVTDILMPRMDGIELIIEAKRLAPTMKIIAYTGDGALAKFHDGPSFLEIALEMGADWAFARRNVSAALIDLIVSGQLPAPKAEAGE